MESCAKSKMSLIVKDVKGNSYTIQTTELDTVLSVKQSLETIHKYGPWQLQKLIYKGKILSNTTTIKDLNIDSSNYIFVCLTNKAVTPILESTMENTQMPEQVQVPVESKQNPPVLEILLSEKYYHSIKQLIEFGFTTEMVLAAFIAAYGNIDRAADYLYQGKSLDELEEMNL